MNGDALAHVRETFGAMMLASRRTRLGLAFLSGMSGAMAQAPVDFLPAFFVTFSMLVWLLDALAAEAQTRWATLRSSLVLGWCFGFGYFLASLWWLGNAFIARGADFIWLMPLGVVALPAVLALFFGLGVMIARLLWSENALRLFALAFGLGFSEWLRVWIFTGFPWNSFGQAFANHLVLVQGASLLGAQGLGLFVPLVFGAPALLLTGRTPLAKLTMPLFAGLLLAALALFGWLRLERNGGVAVDFSRQAVVDGVRLRIMQPNIPQEEKWEKQDGAKLLERFLTLSDVARGEHRSGVADVTHLIWPESPFPFVLDRNPQAMASITSFLPPTTTLLTGAIRVEGDSPQNARYFNTLYAIDKLGIRGTYDKVHLVPFGEYLPFERVLRKMGLEEFVHVVGGFTAAPARRLLRVRGLPPLVPLICFEAIFAHEIAPALADEGVMVTITNDAWFGHTPGPYQHLAQARLRAVEFGQPMVRAANSGISAVYDSFGRQIAALPLDVADVLDSPLPVAATKTLYQKTLWYSFATVMICMCVVALFGRTRSKSKDQ